MKWVEIRSGKYKLVDDDDPRPEVGLESHKGSPNVQIAPPWKKYEVGQMIGNPDSQFDTSEKFEAERQHAMKTDPSWRRWEKSRRERMAKEKPAWRKERMKHA